MKFSLNWLYIGIENIFKSDAFDFKNVNAQCRTEFK